MMDALDAILSKPPQDRDAIENTLLQHDYPDEARKAAEKYAQLREVATAVKKLAETAETHRVEYNRRYGEMEKPVYWDGRRDEAGWFRDQLAAALAALEQETK